MKQTISLSDFRDAFRKMDRTDNFSYEGLELLFDMFEESDPEMELDVIAICCDYNEDNWLEIAKNYNIDIDGDLSYGGIELDEAKKDAVREYLQENTYLVGETDSSFVYQAF